MYNQFLSCKDIFKILFSQLTLRFSLFNCKPIHSVTCYFFPNHRWVEPCIHWSNKYPWETDLCVFLMSGIPSRYIIIVYVHIVGKWGSVFWNKRSQRQQERGWHEGYSRKRLNETSLTYRPLFYCSGHWQECFRYQRTASFHDTAQGHTPHVILSSAHQTN